MAYAEGVLVDITRRDGTSWCVTPAAIQLEESKLDELIDLSSGTLAVRTPLQERQLGQGVCRLLHFGQVRVLVMFLFHVRRVREKAVPAWSPYIANVFIRMALKDRRKLDQIQIQKLVYIAHGWSLAVTNEPLTGDRPEAWEFGPVYRRIADALAAFGLGPVEREIATAIDRQLEVDPSISELDDSEQDLIQQIYQDYAGFSGSQLSSLTRRGNAPWRQVYADGAGEFRDIAHALIKAQFVDFIGQAAANQAERT